MFKQLNLQKINKILPITTPNIVSLLGVGLLGLFIYNTFLSLREGMEDNTSSASSSSCNDTAEIIAESRFNAKKIDDIDNRLTVVEEEIASAKAQAEVVELQNEQLMEEANNLPSITDDTDDTDNTE